MKSRLLLAPLLCVLAVGTAFGHAMHIAVQPDGEGLRGRVNYSDGTVAEGLRISVHDPVADEGPVATAITDASGRFMVTVPAGLNYRIVAEDGRGHRTETTALLPVTVPDLDISATIRNELVPLREDIARLEQRIKLADLVGGLGLLAGLAGLAAWLAARRR